MKTVNGLANDLPSEETAKARDYTAKKVQRWVENLLITTENAGFAENAENAAMRSAGIAPFRAGCGIRVRLCNQSDRKVDNELWK